MFRQPVPWVRHDGLRPDVEDAGGVEGVSQDEEPGTEEGVRLGGRGDVAPGGSMRAAGAVAAIMVVGCSLNIIKHGISVSVSFIIFVHCVFKG